MPINDVKMVLVFVAVTIIAITVSLPLGVFGIVFGPFLRTVADETAATSMANGIFNTALSFTGLAANLLLNKWSCRNVALLGALFCVVGSFGLIPVNDLSIFVLLYGILQGIGYGLLLPASLTALNNAFDRKLSLMTSLSQAIMVGCCISMPPLASNVMNLWGYRRTVLGIALITLLNVPAAALLTKSDWKCQKLTSSDLESNNPLVGEENKKVSKCTRGFVQGNSAAQSHAKVLQIADRASSMLNINLSVDISERPPNFWNYVDFSLLKSPKYLNISIGMSLSFTSDICFISMLPLMLSDLGLDSLEVASTMSLFFGSDLVARILLSVVSCSTSLNSRLLVLAGSLFSIIFRLGFVWLGSQTSKIACLSVLGFLRCFIQTPISLVIADTYQERFATAFSLYMVICGVVTLIFGPLMGAVKAATDSNEMVCHLLTSCYVICAVAWLCEMALDLRKQFLSTLPNKG